MRQFEEITEHRRIERELAELLNDTEPSGLDELGWDAVGEHFRGRRIA
ncbi:MULTISPECIES: hypothetical protein [Streptomycetaceae]